MFRIWAIVLFCAIAYFVYDELKRRKGVVKAEEELGDYQLREKELNILKDVGHQSKTNETIEDDIDAIYEEEATNESETDSNQTKGEQK
jgi:hypothetical protein